jgi:hypothetical protein
LGTKAQDKYFAAIYQPEKATFSRLGQEDVVHFSKRFEQVIVVIGTD